MGCIRRKYVSERKQKTTPTVCDVPFKEGCDTEELQSGVSVSDLLLKRKQHRLTHKLGISTDTLLIPPRRKSQGALFLDQSVSSSSSIATNPSTPKSSDASENIPLEPEEVVVQTPLAPIRLQHTSIIQPPASSSFFELSQQEKITDEELYDRFVQEYRAKGIELAYLRQRRSQQKHKRQPRKDTFLL